MNENENETLIYISCVEAIEHHLHCIIPFPFFAVSWGQTVLISVYNFLAFKISN